MARPTKHSVDYFSHDCSMRNDIKIKALRRKYKHLGYSIYIITLELLGDTEYFQIKWNDATIELLTPEYDCDANELKEIINYCIQLDLFQIDYGYLHCPKFTKRLEDTVLTRRKDYCSNNSPISKLSSVNVYNNEIIDNNNGQSKVKESKLNKSEVEESKLHETKVECSEVNNAEIIYSRQMINNITTKFADGITDRFKLNNFLVEINEDWGGWDNFLDICFGDDVSVKNNYNNKLNEYRNGIFTK